MKNIVLYKSRYGNTKQYATWMAKALQWELRDFSDFRKEEAGHYDKIIFGTGVYMGKMNKLDKALTMFKDKPIVIFACGGNNNDPDEIEVIRKRNFTETQLAFHRFFYVPGGVDFSKVKGPFRLMLGVFRKVMERKNNRTADEDAILEGFTNPTNFVDRKHIEPILEAVRNASSEEGRV